MKYDKNVRILQNVLYSKIGQNDQIIIITKNLSR